MLSRSRSSLLRPVSTMNCRKLYAKLVRLTPTLCALQIGSVGAIRLHLQCVLFGDVLTSEVQAFAPIGSPSPTLPSESRASIHTSLCPAGIVIYRSYSWAWLVVGYLRPTLPSRGYLPRKTGKARLDPARRHQPVRHDGNAQLSTPLARPILRCQS